MRIVTLAVSVSFALLGACGGDDGAEPIDAPPVDAPLPIDAPIDAQATACGTSGNGTINGMLGAVSVGPVARVYQAPAGPGVAIVIDEVGGACGSPSTTGEHIVFGFCAAPAVQTYPVVPGLLCPGGDAFALVERGGGEDLGDGVSGTITITSVAAGCVTGSFDIMFDDGGGGLPDPIAGAFNARVCP